MHVTSQEIQREIDCIAHHRNHKKQNHISCNCSQRVEHLCNDMHPYDLSGGEQQLLALAKVLSTKPKLLLLDEPTKGVDANTKKQLTGILKSLRETGMTIVLVTHDVEFAAETADRCAMFFRGQIVSDGTPREFFSRNSFYTTPISRMTRGIFENAVTLDDAHRLCRLNGRKERAK